MEYLSGLLNNAGGSSNDRPTYDSINSAYDQQQAAAQAQYNNTMAGYDAQAAQLPTQYQAIRNQAYTDNAMAGRSLAERLANKGYSGGGGMSQTLNQRIQSTLLNNVNAANIGQQNALDALNLQRGAAQSQLAGTLADIGLNRANAIQTLNQYLDQQASAERQAALDNANKLYAGGIITAAQYEQMTGIKPQAIKTSGGGGGGYAPWSPPNESPELSGTNLSTQGYSSTQMGGGQGTGSKKKTNTTKGAGTKVNSSWYEKYHGGK